MSIKKREEFPQKVKVSIFSRVNGRCSVPRCTNPTMGPFKINEGAINLGIVCHIYSAAENGPRGQGGKNQEFLASEENGIWCCAYHGNLIDKKNGVDYPAADLFAWKRLAEAWAAKQMNGIPSPLGWISRIEVTKFPGNRLPPALELSKLTLLSGAEASGKTILMELAAGMSDSAPLKRFKNTAPQYKDDTSYGVAGRVIYTTVDNHERAIEVSIEGDKVHRTLDGQDINMPPGDFTVISCIEPFTGRQDHEDDLDYLKRVVGVDDSSLLSLLNSPKKPLLPYKMQLREAEEEIENELGNEVKRKKRKPNGEPFIELITLHGDPNNKYYALTLATHSRSIRNLITLQLTLAKAKILSQHQLTLLVIDGVTASLDEGNFSRLLDAVEELDIQAVIVAPSRRFIESIGNSPVESLPKHAKHGNWSLRWFYDRI